MTSKCVSREDNKIYNYKIIKSRVLSKTYMIIGLPAIFLDEKEFQKNYIDYPDWIDNKIDEIITEST